MEATGIRNRSVIFAQAVSVALAAGSPDSRADTWDRSGPPGISGGAA
jgi:hypothetical protein